MKDKFKEDLKNGIENYGRTGYEMMANIDRLQKQVGFIIFLIIIAKEFNSHNSIRKHNTFGNKSENQQYSVFNYLAPHQYILYEIFFVNSLHN